MSMILYDENAAAVVVIPIPPHPVMTKKNYTDDPTTNYSTYLTTSYIYEK
jgi:hypothetical protein